MCVLLFDDVLGSRPLYPSFYNPRGAGFTWKIESVQLYGTQTLSLLALFTRFDPISIHKLPRAWATRLGSLGWVGRLMVGPLVPFFWVHDTWYPWYQISSASLECLASKLSPNVLDFPVSAKLLSALSDLRLTRWVLLGSGQVLNDSDWVSSSFLKMWIGTRSRCTY
jgi:hypothetical protein